MTSHDVAIFCQHFRDSAYVKIFRWPWLQRSDSVDHISLGHDSRVAVKPGYTKFLADFSGTFNQVKRNHHAGIENTSLDKFLLGTVISNLQRIRIDPVQKFFHDERQRDLCEKKQKMVEEVLVEVSPICVLNQLADRPCFRFIVCNHVIFLSLSDRRFNLLRAKVILCILRSSIHLVIGKLISLHHRNYAIKRFVG